MVQMSRHFYARNLSQNLNPMNTFIYLGDTMTIYKQQQIYKHITTQKLHRIRLVLVLIINKTFCIVRLNKSYLFTKSSFLSVPTD